MHYCRLINSCSGLIEREVEAGIGGGGGVRAHESAGSQVIGCNICHCLLVSSIPRPTRHLDRLGRNWGDLVMLTVGD
jgi:hypothetical protein